MSAVPVLDVLAIVDDAADSLVAPDWEWSSIGDNNLLAWETAAKVGRLIDSPAAECYPIVCRSLRRRWHERFEGEM